MKRFHAFLLVLNVILMIIIATLTLIFTVLSLGSYEAGYKLDAIFYAIWVFILMYTCKEGAK
ncbi:hypothetical protein D1970_00370 [Mesobacillus zeae]|uniref:Uncharacterized protein n=1 Tax=Mesobacillus zeae TaxID=1917180 RepID=A0A398BMJ7_9BACI|nr:hypothetical protein D1970_00370 [Mesobacillus zeae]